MKYRKKPVIVETFQFDGPAFVDLDVILVKSWPGVGWMRKDDENRVFPFVITAHKQKTWIEPGDWIIQESDGRGYYPCKPDIFEATYEPA
jgi:hypothetical protein